MVADTLSIDFETRSTVDLRRTGVYPYANDESTDIWCMAYAFGDEEPQLWVPGDSIPIEVFSHVKYGGELRAWNANFERVIWAFILHQRYGFPLPSREQWFCTMADAAALALPSSLNRAALALGLDQEKDDQGYRLMMQMAKPRAVEEDGTVVWWDDQERRERLYAYCRQDVRVERAVHNRINTLPAREREVYLLDQKINDRGVKVDVPLVRRLQELVEEGTTRANKELKELTDGKVEKFTQVQRLTKWCNQRIEIDNLRKDTIRDVLEEDALPDDIHRALEIRSESAKSSTAKLKSLLEFALGSPGWRARGMLSYHKASTGRWAGRGPQPQNFPRPELKNVERYIPLVMKVGEHPVAKVYDALEEASGEPALVVIASMLRSCFLAADGTRFISGDFSQIEARVLAWFAEQEDLLELFEEGGKVYEDMGAFIFDVPIEEVIEEYENGEGFMRQIGKNSILGAGFQMGADTFAEQVKSQTGVELDRGLREVLWCEPCNYARRTTGDFAGLPCPNCKRPMEQTMKRVEEDMAKKAINGYRGKNHRIKSFWYEIDDAAMEAVRNPDTVVPVGRNGCLRFTHRAQFLYCILPSGRALAYALPRIETVTVNPKDPEIEPFETESVTYMGVNSKTKQWQRLTMYGGKWTENVVQATARDVMTESMLRLEEAGYEAILTVHDEVLAEVPEGQGSLGEFLDTMRERPRWALDLPVEVDGWEGDRYRK